MRYGTASDQCRNLYRFIRLVLGEEISDREIARRWGLDEKNLRELKRGQRVVPKMSRLVSLADVLGVHKYFVLEVASGMPAEKIYRVAQDRALDRDLLEIESAFQETRTERQDKDRMVMALQSAALQAQKTLEPDQIFPRVSRELKKYQFESHMFFLHPETRSASIRHSSFSPRLLQAAESFSGLSLSSFRFPLDRVPPFQAVVDARHPLFLPDASVLLGQILGDRHLQRFVYRMKKIFRILEVVLSPILLQGEVRGVFATGRGGKLNETCLPEMRTFSEQLSCSFENAFLFQQVQRSEVRLRNLFEKLPEGLFECDREGTIVQMNPAGAAMLGFLRPDELIGKPIRHFRLLNPNAQAVRRQENPSPQSSIRNLVGVAERKDGSPFLADITLRTEYDRKGTAESIEGVFRDISRLTTL